MISHEQKSRDGQSRTPGMNSVVSEPRLLSVVLPSSSCDFFLVIQEVKPLHPQSSKQK